VGTLGDLIVQVVVIGCVYAMIAVAFDLVFASSRVVNFAQGDFVAGAGLIAAILAVTHGVPFGIAALAAGVLIALVGMVTVSALILPVLPGITQRSVSDLNEMRWVLTTIGVSVTLEAIGGMLTPQGAIGVKPLINGGVNVAGIHVPLYDIAIVVVAVAMIAGLHMLLRHTIVGQMLRAVAADRYGSAAVGIPVRRVIVATFVGAAALSALAGVLIVPFTQGSASGGFALGLAGFAAATVGGLGDMRGALAGGMVVAAAELMGARFVNSQMESVFPLLVMMLILVFRPQGIFQSGAVERV